MKTITPVLQMVDLQSQYQRIKPEIDTAIQTVLNSTAFIQGDAVKSFSANLAAYLGVKHVIPCGNGTDALQIALMALDLKAGDEVITTPFTFVATVEVIALLGLKPVFVDVDVATFLMNEAKLAEAITPLTKAIIPVHLFGQVANMQQIMRIAEEHQLFVIEDNAQAIGADVNIADKYVKAGSVGHIGCTSFFPSKNLGCYGDGGALFTNDDDLAAKIKMICNHGSKVRYYHEVVGINSRLDTIQAAILEVKLLHLDEYNKARQTAALLYDSLLSDVPEVICPARCTHSTHVFHQYTLKAEKRDELVAFLQEKGIPTGVYYPVPLHIQTAYSYYGYKKGDFSVSEVLAKQVISLPMHTELTPDMQTHIVNSIKDFYQKIK